MKNMHILMDVKCAKPIAMNCTFFLNLPLKEYSRVKSHIQVPKLEVLFPRDAPLSCTHLFFEMDLIILPVGYFIKTIQNKTKSKVNY